MKHISRALADAATICIQQCEDCIEACQLLNDNCSALNAKDFTDRFTEAIKKAHMCIEANKACEEKIKEHKDACSDSDCQQRCADALEKCHKSIKACGEMVRYASENNNTCLSSTQGCIEACDECIEFVKDVYMKKE